MYNFLNSHRKHTVLVRTCCFTTIRQIIGFGYIYILKMRWVQTHRKTASVSAPIHPLHVQHGSEEADVVVSSTKRLHAFKQLESRQTDTNTQHFISGQINQVAWRLTTTSLVKSSQGPLFFFYFPPLSHFSLSFLDWLL